MMPARDECDLLRAIARRPADSRQIHLLAKGIGDWDLLIRLADEHRVLPMLYQRMAEISAAVPPDAMDRLRAEYNCNMLHSMANAAELIAVLKAFDDAGTPAMPFKGVVLAASVYHDLTARAAGDLDLIIHERDLKIATAILQERGYELSMPVLADGRTTDPDPYECHFERQVDGRVLELRWRLDLTQPRFRRTLGMDWVWPSRRTAKLAGAEIPAMSPEMTLLVLCMHGSKHAWSRLLWICDVARLLDCTPDLDWKEVTREAGRSGLWRSLALGVLLAHRVAYATVPRTALERFQSDTAANKLAHHIEENLIDAPGSTPMGRVPYNVQLLGFRDRMSLVLSLDYFRPNERDRAVLSLPRPFHALYYVIRPFRILWDRSAR
jgi:Uncharacterised nucleotidyltransferase